MKNINWDEIKKELGEAEKQESENDVFDSQMVSLPEVESFFEIEHNTNNKYEIRKRLLAYAFAFRTMKGSGGKTLELAQLASIWLKKDYDVLYKNIQSDITELELCFGAKAYKATLILAGSVLEGFLLDWLSEIDGKNYFEEPYMIVCKNAKGKEYKKTEERLSAYIDRINEIERPDWMESCEKAHYIRKKRNTVHAKIGLKQENEINEETCMKVITYLKEIMEARIAKQQKMLDVIFAE